jgi:L-serine dehydratase
MDKNWDISEYNSVGTLAEAAEARHTSISALVLEEQSDSIGVSKTQVYTAMLDKLRVMRAAAAEGVQPGVKSTSGITGGDGRRMMDYACGTPLSGTFCAKAVARAIAVAEYNAGMGKIVAAPTAGSCGIIPGAILTLLEEGGVNETDVVMGLITAGAIGMVITNQASIAGAEGGCQAECGAASAMAAAVIVEAKGGPPLAVAHAVAMALKMQLGLVCDPVAGLVEVPCVKRNAGGVSIAITAATMALAGIKSVIPVDEVIDALREVGDALPATLKETGIGGLAGTPTGLAIKKRVFG